MDQERGIETLTLKEKKEMEGWRGGDLRESLPPRHHRRRAVRRSAVARADRAESPRADAVAAPAASGGRRYLGSP